MSDTVIKKEMHNSFQDQQQEKELLKNRDFDSMVLEGSENAKTQWKQYSAINNWFALLLKFYGWIMSPVYQDTVSLHEIADFKGIDISYTRHGDYELIENTPLSVRATALGSFYLFFLGSMAQGLYTTGYYSSIVGPSLLLLGAIVFPIIILRGYNTFLSKEGNRDALIADKIESADGKVLAIVGASHKPEKHLSDNMEYEVIQANSENKTLSSLGPTILDQGPRVIKSYFILLSLFLVVREGMKFITTTF